MIPFPFTSVVDENVVLDPALFDRIVEGGEGMEGMEYGFCITSRDEQDYSQSYLLFFQRKPYAAGRITKTSDLEPTRIRAFFVYLAQNPKIKLFFCQTDPVLMKSLLVLQDCSPETEGSSDLIRIENLVVRLLEDRKDALVTLIQGGRFSVAFVKEGKMVKAYFSDKIVQSSGGMEWADLFRKIEISRSQGEQAKIRVFEDMTTSPARDYMEGGPDYPGGVYRYYTRSLPELIVRDKTRTLKRISVTDYPFIIGRGAESNIVLNDPGVSRKHAALEEREGKVFVRDLGSLNGIFVNEHFTRDFALQDGDRITVGSHTIQVVLPRSPAEDVSLFTPNPEDATMAMDRNARVRISCPQCRAVGSIDAARIYGGKKITIRCPQCQNRFDPAST
jgi:predicted Zn finger-like uncharacterized protein